MNKTNIFISYTRKDVEQAQKIHKCLSDAGFDVWRDVTDIEPGKNWSREVAQNLTTSDIIVLLWSENATRSDAVRHEWLTARALEKGIIPCFLNPVEKKQAVENFPRWSIPLCIRDSGYIYPKTQPPFLPPEA